jgi:hypothetical protein
LAELRPSEFVSAAVAPEMELAAAVVALLTALIELLMAEVRGLVAVEAEGSSIEGIEALEPFIKTIPPAKKI